MNIIPAISYKILTKYTNFDYYLFIVDAYSKIPILYVIVNFTPEEVIYKLDMFQGRFRNVDEFVWLDLERIQTNAGTKFTTKEFKKIFLYLYFDLH